MHSGRLRLGLKGVGNVGAHGGVHEAWNCPLHCTWLAAAS